MVLARAALLFTVTVLAQAGAQPNAGIDGTVVDADGAPVEGVAIQVRKIDRVPAVHVRSQADGSFRVPQLAPGDYRIIASHAALGTDTNERVRLFSGTSANLRLFLKQPGVCALAPVPGTGTIAGTVVDWNGEPTPADVRIQRPDATWSRRLRTTIDGRFTIDLLPPGRYALAIGIPALEFMTSTVVVEPDQTVGVDVRLDLDRGRNPDVVEPGPAPPLAAGLGGVRGRVTDGIGGLLPGASVSMRSAAGRVIQASANQHGLYSLADLAPDRYDVRVTMAGFETYSSAVVVSAGEWTTGNAALAIGSTQPHGLASKWTLRRSESIVRIETALGPMTLAVSGRDFLACLDRGAYTAGSMERPAAASAPQGAPLLLRFAHNNAHPAATGTTRYALRLDNLAQLVVFDPATGAPAAIAGRVVDGFETLQKIREAAALPAGRNLSLEILSITRLVLL